MDAAESVAARLIGTLFVERGVASEFQVSLALEIQQETDQQLGEILIERFGVSREEIGQVIVEQWQDLGKPVGLEPEAALSENWRRLGDIFVTRGFVTTDELDHALSRQRQTGERLGEALVALGVISKFELAGALAEQMASLDESGAARHDDTEATVHQLRARPVEPQAIAAEASAATTAPSPSEAPTPLPPELRAVELGKTTEPALETDETTEPAPEIALAAPLPVPGVIAFVPTTTGYTLVPLDGSTPEVGELVSELGDLGELYVMRHTSSPLPLDKRTCVVVERRSATTFSFSFAD